MLLKLYDALLYIGSLNNIILAIVLAVIAMKQQFVKKRNYQRSCLLSSLAFTVFGIGYFLHAIYHPRLISPMLATALSISYFHIGGTLFAFSHISLMNPKFITTRMVFTNIAIGILAMVGYWYPFVDTLVPSPHWQWAYLVFFVHLGIFAAMFYHSFRRKRREDPEAAYATLRPFANAFPRSSHLIITFGIGCVILFALYPKSIMLYTILMVVAYYAFYYIFRATENYGKAITDTQQEPKRRHPLISYNAVYHTIVLAVMTTIVVMINDIEDSHISRNTAENTQLNLTSNPIWDHPVIESDALEDLDTLILQSADSLWMQKVLLTEADTISPASCLAILKDLESMPDSPYKSYMKLLCLNNTFVSLPEKDVTLESCREYLRLGYDLAQGPHPVPQLMFYLYWNNIIISLSNLKAIDEVRKEASKLMLICRKNEQPLGLMQAYIALAYLLMDTYDNIGACDQFDKADIIAHNIFPRMLGEDWESISPDKSQSVSEYLRLKSLNARCRMEGEDTLWLKEHHDDLLKTLRTSNEISVLSNYYYTLCVYNDKWGDKKLYEKLLAEFKDLMVQHDLLKQTETSASNTVIRGLYYTVLVRHALRTRHADDAIAIVEEHPEVFTDTTTTYLPDALLQKGRYEEAALRYKTTIDYFYKLLNGHNRIILKNLSSGVEEENQQMMALQSKVDNQRTHIMYNTLLLFIFTIMTAGLTYFLIRQRRLNRELNEAAEAAERANNAKDIFLKNMSHEFHTPMNAVYGFAQILANRDLPLDEESTREMADGIVEGSQHLIKILDNIVYVTDELSKLDKLEDVESILKKKEKEI